MRLRTNAAAIRSPVLAAGTAGALQLVGDVNDGLDLPLHDCLLKWLLCGHLEEPRAQLCPSCAAPEGLGLDETSTGLF